MKVRHLKQSDYRELPWKNGKGKTLQIAMDDTDPFRWRLSSAVLVGASEFSTYEGYQRYLVLLGPGPVRISHEGNPSRTVASFEPYAFSGDLKTKAELVGSAHDFNVFVKRGQAKGSVFAMNLNSEERVDFPLRGDEHFIYCVEGTLGVFERNTDSQYSINPGETLHLKRAPKKECLDLQALAGKGLTRFIWAVVHLVDKPVKAKTLTRKRKAP